MEMRFAPGRALDRTPPRFGGEEPRTCRATEALRSRRKHEQARKEQPPRRKSPNTSPPPRRRGPRQQRTPSSLLAPSRSSRARAAARETRSKRHPCGHGTTSEHPEPPREGHRGARCAEAPEREAHPLAFWTSGLVRHPAHPEYRRPAAACRHRSPPGSLRIPTESPLEISNDSSRNEPLVSWPPATGKGQPPWHSPTWLGCSHPKQEGFGVEMSRPQLSPLVASATRSGSRTTLPAEAEDREVPDRQPGIPQGVPRRGGTWERTSPHGTAATSERWRSRDR